MDIEDLFLGLSIMKDKNNRVVLNASNSCFAVLIFSRSLKRLVVFLHPNIRHVVRGQFGPDPHLLSVRDFVPFTSIYSDVWFGSTLM